MASLRPAELLLLVAVGAVLLRWNLWRAVLFFRPSSIRLLADSPAGMEPVTGALEAAHEALLALGFVSLGTHLEHPRFGARHLSWDYAHPVERAFASLSLGLSKRPRLYLLSRTTGGGFVITADHRRPAREVKGRYLAGSVEGASPERLLNAHRRRAAELGAIEAEWTLEGRVAAGRDWYAGAGRAEVRLQNAVGLLWTVGALGMVGAAFFGKDR